MLGISIPSKERRESMNPGDRVCRQVEHQADGRNQRAHFDGTIVFHRHSENCSRKASNGINAYGDRFIADRGYITNNTTRHHNR